MGKTAYTATTLADVLVSRKEKSAWLWPGYLPAGALGIFDGDPGLGKSMVTMDIAARVTKGATWPDKTRGGAPGSVLVLAAEDSKATLVSRLKAAGADLRMVVTLDDVAGHTPSLPDDISIIEEIVVARNVKLVIIDPIMVYLGVTAYRDQSIRQAVAPLAAMAQRTGACVVMVRHLTKGGGRNAKHAGGGTMGLIGQCRFGYIFGTDPDDPKKRVFANTKLNLAEEPVSLGYEVVTRNGAPVADWNGKSKWSADDVLSLRRMDTESRIERDEMMEFLLDVLMTYNGIASPVDIKEEAKKAGYSWQNMRTAKKKLGVKAIKIGANWYWEIAGVERKQILRIINARQSSTP